MGSEDCHSVAALLEANGCIDDEALRPANPEIGMEEDDVLPPLCSLLFDHGNEFVENRRVLHGGWFEEDNEVSAGRGRVPASYGLAHRCQEKLWLELPKKHVREALGDIYDRGNIC